MKGQKNKKRLRKILAVSLMTWLLGITVGCKTTKVDEAYYPPEPKRQVVAEPESIEDYAELLVYYESLVEEWEAWANFVKGEK